MDPRRKARNKGAGAPVRRHPSEPDLTGVPLDASILENLRREVISSLHPGMQFKSKEYRNLSLPKAASKQQLQDIVDTMVKEQREINSLLKARRDDPQPGGMVGHSHYPPPAREIGQRHSEVGSAPAPVRTSDLLERLKKSGVLS